MDKGLQMHFKYPLEPHHSYFLMIYSGKHLWGFECFFRLNTSLYYVVTGRLVTSIRSIGCFVCLPPVI